jgi:hypothetical protein
MTNRIIYKFWKSLATSVCKSHTQFLENKSTLENPTTLGEFYEATPKDLVNVFIHDLKKK